jgi:hypothetical protein
MKWIVVLAAVGCSGKPAREVCERAANHFERCVGEVFGTDMKQLARDHREINSCANDANTVKMYEKCEAQKSCELYLDCLDGYSANE